MPEYLQTLDNGDVQVIDRGTNKVYTLDAAEWQRILMEVPDDKKLWHVQRADKASTTLAEQTAEPPAGANVANPTPAVPGQPAGNAGMQGGAVNNPRESR